LSSANDKYEMEVSANNKINKYAKNIVIYFAIAMFTIIMNIPIFIYVTWYFITNVSNYLSENISFLYIKKPIILLDGMPRVLAIDLMLNIFLVLIIEFFIVWLFHKRLNTFFKINDLFAMKKIYLLAILIIVIQMIFSFLLWYI